MDHPSVTGLSVMALSATTPFVLIVLAASEPTSTLPEAQGLASRLEARLSSHAKMYEDRMRRHEDLLVSYEKRFEDMERELQALRASPPQQQAKDGTGALVREALAREDGNAVRVNSSHLAARRLDATGATHVSVVSRHTHEFPSSHTCGTVAGYMAYLPIKADGSVSWKRSPSDVTEQYSIGTVADDWTQTRLQALDTPLKIVHDAACSVAPTLDLSLATTVQTLTVSGALTASTLTANGATTMNGGLTVGSGGALTVSSAATMSGTLAVGSTLNVGGTTTMNGALYLAGTNDLTVGGTLYLQNADGGSPPALTGAVLSSVLKSLQCVPWPGDLSGSEIHAAWTGSLTQCCFKVLTLTNSEVPSVGTSLNGYKAGCSWNMDNGACFAEQSASSFGGGGNYLHCAL